MAASIGSVFALLCRWHHSGPFHGPLHLHGRPRDQISKLVQVLVLATELSCLEVLLFDGKAIRCRKAWDVFTSKLAYIISALLHILSPSASKLHHLLSPTWCTTKLLHLLSPSLHRHHAPAVPRALVTMPANLQRLWHSSLDALGLASFTFCITGIASVNDDGRW